MTLEKRDITWLKPDVWQLTPPIDALTLKKGYTLYVAQNLPISDALLSCKHCRRNRPFLLRIATWNVHFWSDVFGKSNFPQILGELAKMDADVLCLQEVNMGFTQWMPCTAEQLLTCFRKIGYHYWHFCGTTHFHGAPFGNLTLSRYPMTSQSIPLARDPIHNEKRCFIQSQIYSFNTNIYLCTVLNAHLDVWDKTGKTRQQQVQTILETIDEKTPTVLCGDFNSVYPTDYSPDVWKWVQYETSSVAAQQLLRSRLTSAFDKSHSDFDVLSTTRPPSTVWSARTVDNIFLSTKAKKCVAPYTTYPVYSLCSDHIALRTDLILDCLVGKR
jgi:endonuclease/exonuclease/phosphatase family metal-dependent hydrolase